MLHLSFMNRGTLIAELNRMLDAGEPLLDVFPKEHPNDWWVQLPDNISDEMLRYADDVSYRAYDWKSRQDFWKQATTDYLAALVERRKIGLLGWRAIGVLK